jgi:hypothetical protein
MKKLINYFTPVGAEQIAIAKAFVIVTSVTISILFYFQFYPLYYDFKRPIQIRQSIYFKLGK